MLPAVFSALTLAGALLLLVAGVGHLRDLRLFLATLRAQRLLPAGLHQPVSLLTPVAELLAGVLAVVAVPWAGAWPLLVPQAVLYLLFSGYLAVLVRTRPGTPCGCFGARTPATWATAARAVLGAVATAATAVLPPVPRAWLAPVAAAALLLAGTDWLVPNLRRDPAS
ncbi:hypothetical protein JOF53_006359 [Crossiella equi]|uniref:Methylamine utilisation protein MauE domain-containing protein n=1 Tax=Crossiella equi TaxID=130796 RepID=A0ABS5ALM9_9PSEU|nr:MauE/DoxX family redox-associated membrane protein [Crossiella equi]MBP2477487.1 hypothetical protein [Crossiella equi]